MHKYRCATLGTGENVKSSDFGEDYTQTISMEDHWGFGVVSTDVLSGVSGGVWVAAKNMATDVPRPSGDVECTESADAPCNAVLLYFEVDKEQDISSIDLNYYHGSYGDVAVGPDGTIWVVGDDNGIDGFMWVTSVDPDTRQVLTQTLVDCKSLLGADFEDGRNVRLPRPHSRIVSTFCPLPPPSLLASPPFLRRYPRPNH